VDSADDAGSSSDNTSSQYAILAISLLVTTVVGYVNFMNPAQRWQQLRGTHCIIWQYSLCLGLPHIMRTVW
jgi:hypothetical protein